MLVYTTPIHICKYKELNCTKNTSNNSTVVHILQHKGKSSIFAEKDKMRLEKGKKRQKKGKNAQKHIKNKEFSTIFEKVSHTTIACMKGLYYALHCVKCTSFT